MSYDIQLGIFFFFFFGAANSVGRVCDRDKQRFAIPMDGVVDASSDFWNVSILAPFVLPPWTFFQSLFFVDRTRRFSSIVRRQRLRFLIYYLCCCLRFCFCLCFLFLSCCCLYYCPVARGGEDTSWKTVLPHEEDSLHAHTRIP